VDTGENKCRMNKKTALLHRIFVPLGVGILLCTAWTIALNTDFANAETRTVTAAACSTCPVPESVYIEVEKPVYVQVEKLVTVVETVEVEKIVSVDRIVEVPVEVTVKLRDWENKAELTEFLKNDDTDTYLFLKADNAGGIAFNGQCEDLALQLRDRAMSIGKYLSVQVLSPQEYEKWYGVTVGPGVYHAICMARIGNEFWYIEPDNDRHWPALNLD
jgi:hypothetical protein